MVWSAASVGDGVRRGSVVRVVSTRIRALVPSRTTTDPILSARFIGVDPIFSISNNPFFLETPFLILHRVPPRPPPRAPSRTSLTLHPTAGLSIQPFSLVTLINLSYRPGVPDRSASDLGNVEEPSKGGDVAAVILKPVVDSSGFVNPTPEFLEGCRELCTKHGTLLVTDEFMAGFRIAYSGAQVGAGVAVVVGDLAGFKRKLDFGKTIAPRTGL